MSLLATTAEVNPWVMMSVVGGFILALFTLLFSIHIYAIRKVRDEAADNRGTQQSIRDHQGRIEALESQTAQLSAMQNDLRYMREEFHHIRQRLDSLIDRYLDHTSEKGTST